jgi:hypothetical protein
MQEWEITENKGNKIVDVYLNCCASAGNSATQLTNYGACALSIVDFLESNGVRVNLYAYDATLLRQKNSYYLQRVLIKSATEPLNIPIASFALCCPAMLRVVFFKTQEMIPDLFQGGYGASTNFPNNILSSEENIINFGTLDTAGACFNTDQDCINYLNKKIPAVLNDLQLDLEYNKF